MKRLTPLLLLALLGACSDDPSGPKPVRSVEILNAGAPVDSHTLQVGQTVQLSATPEDAAGKPLTGRKVTWSSTVPSVARVDTTGLVTAVRPGAALVIATSEAAADTVDLTVVAPPSSGEVACAPGDAGLSLAVGEVRTMDAQQASLLCLSGGAGGAEFAYIPFNSTSTAQQLALEVAAGGVTGVSASISASRLPSRAALGEMQAGDDRFHGLLRRFEREHFDALRSAWNGPRPSYSLSGAAVPAVGETLQLNAQTDPACTQADMRTATVEAVTERAIVAADAANPAGGFTRAEYLEFARFYDAQIHPLLLKTFGPSSDLDQNQRVIIFFTKAVNDLTEPNSDSYTGGFFHPRDLYPKTGTNSCAGSNFAEVLYLLVPDSARAAEEKPENPSISPFAKENVKQRTLGVVAHELQHLINAARRLELNAGPEAVWLNEGLSHIAEELIFYAVSGLRPEQNVTLEMVRGAGNEAVRTAINAYQVSNLARYRNYLRAPEGQSLLGSDSRDDDLETRGATWAFLRYAADRETEPGAQAQIWYKLVNSGASGVENLRQAFATDPLLLMQDWTVSAFTDDYPGVSFGGSYQQPSWNFRSLLPVLNDGEFPLKTIPLPSGGSGATLSLQGGGAAFLRFGVAAGSKAAIKVTSGGAPAPTRLKISLVRTR